MNTVQKRKILQRIAQLEQDIDTLKQCRVDIASKGYASATMSSGGGSKSYTRIDLSKITEAITAMTNELKKLKAMLKTIGEQSIWKNVLVVYDM